MQKKYYMAGFVVMLILLALTFFYQVKNFSSGQNDWLYLAVIIVVGIGSYFLGKKMKKEHWFLEQGKKN